MIGFFLVKRGLDIWIMLKTYTDNFSLLTWHLSLNLRICAYGLGITMKRSIG